jgi:hypothetical protein
MKFGRITNRRNKKSRDEHGKEDERVKQGPKATEREEGNRNRKITT